jgi:hypothetical protein
MWNGNKIQKVEFNFDVVMCSVIIKSSTNISCINRV